MATADIGLIGLAVMGENIVLNMESRGYTVAVFNRTTAKVDEFLAGPTERRIAQAVRRDRELTPAEAKQLLKKTDRAREAYVRQYYGVDATDASLYHLVIDATALREDDLVEIVAAAAMAREAAASTG